jgi:probable rRNA maturation factor
LEVHVNAEAFGEAPASLIAAAVRHTLATQGAHAGEVSVTLLDHEAIRALNRDYLGHDHATDVIAFSLGDAETLGDVYVGFDRARSQAAEHGVDLREELVRLAIHGTLHVLGLEHPDGPEREESPMFVLQERLVREVLGGD